MYATNLNQPLNQSNFLSDEPSQAFLQEAWALPFWSQLPYRSVEVRLPDGSSFLLPAPDLAIKAARTLKLPDAEHMAHLLHQVMPILQECPEFLLEVAGKLSWAEAQLMARSAFWQSPCMLLELHFKERAQMSLTPQVVH